MILALAAVALLAASAGVYEAHAAMYYADATKVNLFRRVDVDGNSLVTATWANASVGVSGYGAPAMIDRALSWAGGVNWAAGANDIISLQVTLPQSVAIGDLFYSLTEGNLGELPQEYRIQVSDTGFGALSTAVDWTAFPSVWAAAIPLPAGTSGRYVQVDLRGASAWNMSRFGEFEAHAPAGAQIDVQTAGYNLFSQRATAVIHSHSNNWPWDSPAGAIDLGGWPFLRPPAAGGVTADSWFIVDLGSSFELTAAAVGLTGAWVNGVTIDVSPDNSLWQTAYTTAYLAGSAMLPFGQRLDARYVRVFIPAGNSAALGEFELFATPEPGALALLALGGLALLHRGRRRA
jgi:hypothetical protein